MHILKNRLTTVDFLASPHCDDRPQGVTISLLVIHNISLPPKQFGGTYIEDFFTGKLDDKAHPYFETIKSSRVSSHLLIKRDGSIIQFVPFDKRAWHAGVSCFKGKARCNDFSIGIELEGADDINYTDQQYDCLARATCEIKAHYSLITPDRIVGHDEIAPGRKTDPGPAFDWTRYFELLSIK